MISRRMLLLAVPAAMLSWAAVSQSCEFCQAEKGPTLAEDFSQASLVLLVHADKPSVYEGNSTYSTELVVDQVFKDHEIIKGKKTITLKRRVETKLQFVLFCDVYKNTIDAYRGVEVAPKSDFLKYFEGARALVGKPIAERLRYSFDYLNNSDLEVARDAYKEYANADYSDYKALAKDLPAQTLVGWIRDPKTPPFRVSLYASLLGHCGTRDDARLLREKIEDAIEHKKPEIHGLLAGYFMLDSKEAYSFLTKVLGQEKEEFFVRHACLSMARFLREQRPDLVPGAELNKAVGQLLQFPVMADMGIDYLAKAKAWDWTGKILDLYGKEKFDNEFLKRAILRFALVSPEPRAVAFVKDLRARNPEFVNMTEELLKLSQQEPLR